MDYHPEQKNEPDVDIRVGENSLDGNAMGYKSDEHVKQNCTYLRMKLYQSIPLCGIISRSYEGFEFHLTVVQLIDPTNKTNYLTCKHREPKLGDPLPDAELCTILLPMVP